ncbi:hypothetical protein [Acinetobacter sp. HR7]|uniref:hypothetical protein n=1 Tax=Acinetobacter sp. HR7 TaxID=1509403 RepID=UPI000538DB1D|nr:hypothetical protein [Acinetobacter sp. HR7]KGT46144.1 hypothetical protein GW12_28080 [Acinetobacter sp. HR7]
MAQHEQSQQQKSQEQPLKKINDQLPQQEQLHQQPQGQPLKQVNNPPEAPKH